MSYGIVYEITCIPTGLRYVGQTVSELRKRWNGHIASAKSGSTWIFSQAIREHGSESFQLKVLCECESAKELNVQEMHFIQTLNTVSPNGYNMRDYAGAICDDTRQKMRAAKLGTKASLETRQRMSESRKGKPSGMLGKKHSEKTKAKTSQSLMGVSRPPRTEEHSRNLRTALKGHTPWNKGLCDSDNPNFGKIRSIEARQRMSVAAKGRPKSVEHIESINKHVDHRHATIVELYNECFTFDEIVAIVHKSPRYVTRALDRAVIRKTLKREWRSHG